jgi:protein phosphatase
VSIVLRAASVSITGNWRENNEDRCLVDPQGRYFLVADGMGGQCAGEKASEMAIELIPQRLDQSLRFGNDTPKEVVRGIDEAVSHANGEIMALSELDPQFRSMGTTVALLLRSGDCLFAAGVGDSPIYLMHKGSLRKLTQDHSLTRALLDSGTITEEEARRHRFRNVLYRYLGTKEGGTGTNPCTLQLQAGDRYLLCSDGVTDGLAESEIARLLEAASTPEQAAHSIVQAAVNAGSKDNITCIAVFAE